MAVRYKLAQIQNKGETVTRINIFSLALEGAQF
jgi:hypothetical protein